MLRKEYYEDSEFEELALKAKEKYNAAFRGTGYHDFESLKFRGEHAKRIRKMTCGDFTRMDFNKKADYADDITIDLCKHGQTVILQVINRMIIEWTLMTTRPPSQYIANFCYVTKRVNDAPIRTRAVEVYKKVMAISRDT